MIISSAGIGKRYDETSMDPVQPASTSTSPRTSPSPGVPADAGNDAASVYEEQKNLESLLEKTIDVSGESSGEDEIPEEILLNSSSESCPDPSKLQSLVSTQQKGSTTVTTNSESGSLTHNLATNSDTQGETSATNSAYVTALALAIQPALTATVAIESESASAPVAKESEAGPSSAGTSEKMEVEPSVEKKIPIPGEYYAIQTARKHMRTVPDLNGGYPAASKQPGSFYPPGDSRINICNVAFDIKDKQVCSTSFNPGSMECHCCGKFMDRWDSGMGRQTFVLSDQNFPATLPSDNTGLKCMKIVRIEGGRLGELADKFISLTAGWLVPPGSLLLIGSLSHLAETGVAAYTADLCAAVARLSAYFNKKLSVAPAPFSLSEDTEDAHLIRSVHELYAWTNACLKHVEGLSTSALNAAMEGLIYNGGGHVQPDVICKYRLPNGFTDNNSQIWTSSGLSGLPSRVKRFDMEMEAEIMGRLLDDLNRLLGMDLQPNPYYDRNVEKEDLLPADTTVYILVGGSHALRTANGLVRLGKRAIAATVAGWRPTPEMITTTISKIKKAREMCPDLSKAVCVLQLWDNCSYFVRDEEGGLSAPKKEADGKHHIKGAAVFAHQDTQLLMFKKTLPILDEVKDMRRIILSQLPRYLQARCCSQENHTTNFGEEDYKQKLEASVYEAKNNLRAYSFREGIRNLRVIGAWHLVKKDDIWGSDPVHMKERGYDILAKNVVSTAQDMEGKRKAEDSAAGTAKKPRTESGPHRHQTDNHRQQQHQLRDGRSTNCNSHNRGGSNRGWVGRYVDHKSSRGAGGDQRDRSGHRDGSGSRAGSRKRF